VFVGGRTMRRMVSGKKIILNQTIVLPCLGRTLQLEASVRQILEEKSEEKRRKGKTKIMIVTILKTNMIMIWMMNLKMGVIMDGKVV
jgi:hypothetical protein